MVSSAGDRTSVSAGSPGDSQENKCWLLISESQQPQYLSYWRHWVKICVVNERVNEQMEKRTYSNRAITH